MVHDFDVSKLQFTFYQLPLFLHLLPLFDKGKEL